MSCEIKYIIDDKFATVWLSHGNSLSRIKNFAYGIKNYTNAEIARVWATTGDGVNIPAKEGNTQSLQHSAMIFMRSVADGNLYGHKILSPNFDACFNDDQEVLIETGEHVAELYSALAGSEFLFEHGAFKS